MERVDKDEVDKYAYKVKKNLKKIKRDHPSISKRDLMRQKGDPAISLYHPLKYFGSISEKMEEKLKDYIENESVIKQNEKRGDMVLKSKFKPIKGDTFKKTYYLKYMKSLVHPGENVGTIAA